MDHRRTEKLVREVVRGLMREITDIELRIAKFGMETATKTGLLDEHEQALDRLREARRRAA